MQLPKFIIPAAARNLGNLKNDIKVYQNKDIIRFIQNQKPSSSRVILSFGAQCFIIHSRKDS